MLESYSDFFWITSAIWQRSVDFLCYPENNKTKKLFPSWCRACDLRIKEDGLVIFLDFVVVTCFSFIPKVLCPLLFVWLIKVHSQTETASTDDDMCSLSLPLPLPLSLFSLISLLFLLPLHVLSLSRYCRRLPSSFAVHILVKCITSLLFLFIILYFIWFYCWPWYVIRWDAQSHATSASGSLRNRPLRWFFSLTRTVRWSLDGRRNVAAIFMVENKID